MSSSQEPRVGEARERALAALAALPSADAFGGPRVRLKAITRTHAAERVRAALVRHKRVARADVFVPAGDAGTIHIKVDTLKRRGGPGEWWGPKVRKTLGIVTFRLEGGEEDSAAEIQPVPRDATIRRALETALRGYRVLPAPGSPSPRERATDT